jgi:hypothetical protein
MGRAPLKNKEYRMHIRSKNRTPEEWQEVIKDWEKSGLSKKAFCREKQMNEANFHVWIKRLYPSSVKQHFRDISSKWESILTDWEKSGLGTHTYCKAKNIEPATFYRWKNRIRPFSGKARWIRALQQWEPLIDEWEKSGLSEAAFCKEKKLNNPQFYGWIKRLRPSLYTTNAEKFVKKWEPIIEDWKKSGLNKYVYCRERGIKWQVFCKWEKRINPSHKPHSEENRAKWSAIIEDWKQSGMSQSEYIVKHDLTYSFYLWKKRLHPFSIKQAIESEALKKWTEIIEDWKQSGWEKFTYCKKKGIDCGGFYRWLRRLNPEESSQRLSEIKSEPHALSATSLKNPLIPNPLSFLLPDRLPSSPLKVELILAQGHRFTLEGNFDEGQLGSFIVPFLKR